MSENDDEDNGTTRHGRPNAFWAKVREEQNLAREGDQFGGAYRGVKPAPHGGTATVKPEDTLGAEDLCWCGQPAGHSWPGKNAGARHPKVNGDTMTTTTGLDRRDLRAYDKTLQDFVLHCVNTLGVKYRANQNSILLFPPDGSTPMSVFARNSQKQLRPLEKWFTEHVAPSFEPEEPEETVSEEDLKKLAAAKNHPVEHPKDPTPQHQHDNEEGVAQELHEAEGRKAYEIPPATDTEWQPYVKQDGTRSPNIVTNGTTWKCVLCVDTDHPLESENVRSVGGHNRIYHTDTSDMHSPEAREKAIQTKRQRIMANSQVIQAINLLMDASGYNPNPVGLDELQVELEREVARGNALAEQVEVLTHRAEEAEAKLALIREATGL